MSGDASAVLALPYIQPAQAQKHVTHNEALRLLDVLVQLAVASRSQTSPPADPLPGQRYLVPEGATGAFAGQEGRIALYDETDWAFVPPLPGWQAQVLDEGCAVVFDGTAWTGPEAQAHRFGLLGVGAQADAVNPLVVAGPATLLTHAGGGHQLKINKAAPTDTASLLFQTGWAGRAEMGTSGSEDFAIKVSPDGSTWHTAASFAAATGQASFQTLNATAIGGLAITQNPGDATSGRLLKVADSATLLSASRAQRVVCSGPPDAIILTTGAGLSGPPPAGLELRFRATAGNSGPVTITLDGGTPIACRTLAGGALPAGYIRNDAETLACFDGSFWVLDRQIERGSNANGDFLRLADGTQICTHVLGGLGPIQTADGALFRSAEIASGTWPAAFVVSARPMLSVAKSVGTASVFGGSLRYGAGSTVRPPFFLWAAQSSAATDFTATITALGRWF